MAALCAGQVMSYSFSLNETEKWPLQCHGSVRSLPCCSRDESGDRNILLEGLIMKFRGATIPRLQCT